MRSFRPEIGIPLSGVLQAWRIQAEFPFQYGEGGFVETFGVVDLADLG